jgi:hypothetical protein
MGVTRWLDRIEPQRWTDACGVLAERPPTNAVEAADFLDRFGVSMDDQLASDCELLSSDGEDHGVVLSDLLEKVVTSESWYLGKALQPLEPVLKALPGTRVVIKQIIDFGGLDLEPPDCCSPDSCFYGACSSEAIRASAEALSRFQEIADILAVMNQCPKGLFAAFSKTTSRAKQAHEALQDENLWCDWKELGIAVITCVESGHHLGLGMSA